MITMVVPTRNRAYTLRLVAESYFRQELVNEIIFVDDAGDDNTADVVRVIGRAYPHVALKVLRNGSRQGASQSRNVGVAAASNELILFCDDDEYLEPGYAKTCLEKLEMHEAAAVSGRRIYLHEHETLADALCRFGNGLRRAPVFRTAICEYVNGAIFNGDIELPFTNAVILTRASLLRQYPFDGYYARGNGYREETDYQMNLFVNGHRIIVTNACHSFHLTAAQTRVGGQRTSPWVRLYWSIFYTRYFFSKYYDRYARRLGLKTPRWAALAAFAVFCTYRDLVRSRLHQAVLRARANAARRSTAWAKASDR